VNHRQIEIFAAIMRAGTASGAAEALDTSQPAISRGLAELERVIGFALFDRVRQRLIPTPEARQFLRVVDESYRGLDTLRAEAARIRDHGTGAIRVASLSLLSTGLVPRAIRRFRDQHPDITVTLHVLLSREVRNLVAAGEFDIGLAADEIDTAGVAHSLFLAKPALCVLPSAHRLAAKPVIRAADLAGEEFVTYVPEDRARQRIDRMFAEAGIIPRVVVETIYGATLCALVAEGVGIGLVSPYAVGPAPDPRLAVRPFEPAVPIQTLLILPPDRPKSRLVKDFIDALMKSR
jgi:DNA-binding transcriptional LysR family regulator